MWSLVQQRSFFPLLALSLILSCSITAHANELADALDLMYSAAIDSTSTRTVDSLAITHKNVSFKLKDGTIAFFPPVTIGGIERYWGCVFQGTGQFDFAPPVKLERDQLVRFFEKDSLSGTFSRVCFLFSDSIAHLIMASSEKAGTNVDPLLVEWGNDTRKSLTKDENRSEVFAVLQAIAQPTRSPLLIAELSVDGIGRIWYHFRPYEREEIRLDKERRELIMSYRENICQYSQYVDPTYRMINGISKAQTNAIHYDIDASIKRDGELSAKTVTTFTSETDSLRVVELDLHYDLTVDSITDKDGQPVAFRRFKNRDHREYACYLFLNSPLARGDTTAFTFYYHGKIAEAGLNVFYVTASIFWVPRMVDQDGATYAMTFSTPKGTEFVASGDEVERKEENGLLVTRWKIGEPTTNACFSIGYLKKYHFADDQAGSVDVYYDPDVTLDIARTLADYGGAVGSHMEKVVGEDIINSLRLFNFRFGDKGSKQLVATQSFATHGEAFYNFAHLSFVSWINMTDEEADRQLRAHEMAHQWWGLGVGNETYHDTWLSEGFAEYSALMYLQTAMGNKVFLKWLDKYQKDIFESRNFLLGKSAQEGPIALGYRTSDSKDASGAYGLIIYQKGAYVLHMLRNLFLDLKTMNEDAFFDMMKEWYSTYKGKQATTADFKRLTEKYTGVDMSWFFNQWVYGNDLPTYTFSYTIEPDSNNTFRALCTVLTEGVDENFIADVPIEIKINDQRTAYVRIPVSGAKYDFVLPGLPEKPQKLIFNAFESILAEVKQ